MEQHGNGAYSVNSINKTRAGGCFEKRSILFYVEEISYHWRLPAILSYFFAEGLLMDQSEKLGSLYLVFSPRGTILW